MDSAGTGNRNPLFSSSFLFLRLFLLLGLPVVAQVLVKYSLVWSELAVLPGHRKPREKKERVVIRLVHRSKPCDSFKKKKTLEVFLSLGDFDTTRIIRKSEIDLYLEGIIVKLRAENNILGDFNTTIIEVCILKRGLVDKDVPLF